MVATTFVLALMCLFNQQVNGGGGIAAKDLSYTSNERKALEEFKPRVMPLLKSNYTKTDFYLIRWLRARNLNVQLAEAMLLQHLQWRQLNNVDGIQQENWSDMETDFPYHMNTYDLQGQPVGTVDIYEWDLRRVVLQGKTPRLLRYLYRLLEDVTGQIMELQASGKNVTRFVVLGNADGFNLIQHACTLCLPVWIQFVRSFEGQYPGFLDEVIVVESPATVNVVLDLIRPILSPETQAALKIFEHNRDKWMQYLDAKIARDQRTVAYGGIKKD